MDIEALRAFAYVVETGNREVEILLADGVGSLEAIVGYVPVGSATLFVYEFR